jgi:hypothetical protein
MKAILAGFGEIGQGVYEVFSEYHEIEVADPGKNREAPDGEYEILLIAIPCFDDFNSVVKNYQKKYKAKSTLIFSTVKVGTCRELGAAHSPVEGKHPRLGESIKKTDKWLGGDDERAKKFLEEAGFKVINLEKPEHTEFMKLRSTTVFGVNVEFARYSKEVCDKIGLEYDYIKQWDGWVNDIVTSDWYGNPNVVRPILDAPSGPKGGHCVTPNAKILNKQFPNEMVRIVAEEN